MSRAKPEAVENRRAIIDRRGIADALAALPPKARNRHGQAAAILRGALEQGRAEIATTRSSASPMTSRRMV